MPGPWDVAGLELPDVAWLRARRTAKWAKYGDGVLAAWVAEMDFGTAPPIRKALYAAVDREDFGYAPSGELTELPAACADYLAAAYGWQVDPADVYLATDVLAAVGAAIRTFSPPGSAVVLPTPSYPPFFDTIRMCGRAVVEVPMVDSDAGPAMDLAAIGRAMSDGAATVILCNPHNPTGRVYSRSELSALAKTVDGAGGRVVADEVHGPLVYPHAEHVPYASLSAVAARHAVTMTSASKGWNLPGLKCAQVVITDDEASARWRGTPFVETGTPSPLGIAANHAAYVDGRPWLADVVSYLGGNRSLLAELLAGHLPGVGYRIPDGTYLAWLDCRALGQPDPAGFFLDNARVALSTGAAFGAGYERFARLNFATSRQLLTTIVEQLGAAVRQ